MFEQDLPDVPFIAILGTSHTAGDCDDGVKKSVDKSYGEILAQQLGLEYVNLGMSGASSFDHLEIANELTELGLLKNCKIFLLEPRLGTGTINISRDPTIEYYYNDFFQNVDEVRESLTATEYYRKFIEYDASTPPTLEHFYFPISLGEDRNVEFVRKKLITQSASMPNISEFELKKFLEYINNKVYYEASTSYQKIQDLTNILSIKNIVYSAGVKEFGWFNFNGAPVNHPLVSYAYKYYLPLQDLPKDVFNRREFSLMTYLEEFYTKDYINNNTCQCGHYNQKIHNIIADTLYRSLNERANN